MAKKHHVLKNAATVGMFTSLSRVLGLAREMLQSRFIGAGVEQSAFALAFAIPNMARKLFGEGALTAAFVPVFKGQLETQSMEQARKLARAVMTMALLMLGSIVVLVFAGLQTATVFSGELELGRRSVLTISLVKTMLPYMIFICAAAFGMAVLNSMGRFKAASFMPSLLNIGWIAMLCWIWFHPGLDIDRRIHLVAAAILVSGAIQMIYMFICMHKAGITPGLVFKGWGDANVKLVWKNTAVAAMGAGAVQINYMLDQVLGQVASPWAAGVIGYAERLMDLPLGVIGVAFGTVLLPAFAGFFARGDVGSARQTLLDSTKQMLFIMMPAAAGLGILAPSVVDAIYCGGAFVDTDTIRVARAVSAYSFGLAFFGFQKALVPWFQAQNDMKTPLRVSVYTVFLNAAFNLLAVFCLPEEWRHVGLAASTVLCSAAGCALLVFAARRRNGPLMLFSIVPFIAKIIVGCLVMACVIIYISRVMGSYGGIAVLAVAIPAGAASYFVSMAVMGAKTHFRKPGKMIKQV